MPTNRILTTHVGSLPRGEAVVDQLLLKERAEPFDIAVFDRAMRECTAGDTCTACISVMTSFHDAIRAPRPTRR